MSQGGTSGLRSIEARVAGKRMFAVIAALGLAAGMPAEAFAQEPGPSSAPAADPASPGSEARVGEARQHYQRGLDLFAEKNFDAARVEFERSYQLAPSNRILYNVGLAYEQLGDYVSALSALQRYLDGGGTEVPPERREEVLREIRQIKPRIGKLRVHVNVDGAQFQIDDGCATDAGTGTEDCLAASGRDREVLVNPGRRRITVRKTGYLPDSQSVTAAGSDTVVVNVTLHELPKSYVERKQNPFLIPTVVGWSVAGAGVIAGAVLGGLTLSARSNANSDANRLGSTNSQVHDDFTKAQTLGYASSAAFIASGVVAVGAAYFTYRAVHWKNESANANLNVGLGSVSLSGSF